MRLSQRMGLIPIKVDIQKDGMDRELRIGLWNVFYSILVFIVQVMIYCQALFIKNLS